MLSKIHCRQNLSIFLPFSIYKDELIGGGGRYDDLPSMLGFKQDIFCFGFAIDISKLTDILSTDEW